MTAVYPTRPNVDEAAFAAEVEAALVAFRSDVSYAVSIARSASTILHKRTVWAARRGQRADGPDDG